MPQLNLFEAANAIATLILATILAWAKVKEKRMSKELDLAGNPERCKDHEDRLRDMEKACVGIAKDIENIKEDLNEIKRRLP